MKKTPAPAVILAELKIGDLFRFYADPPTTVRRVLKINEHGVFAPRMGHKDNPESSTFCDLAIVAKISISSESAKERQFKDLAIKTLDELGKSFQALTFLLKEGTEQQFGHGIDLNDYLSDKTPFAVGPLDVQFLPWIEESIANLKE